MPPAGNTMKAFILLVVGLQSLLIFGASGPWLDGSTDLARVLSVNVLLDKLIILVYYLIILVRCCGSIPREGADDEVDGLWGGFGATDALSERISGERVSGA
jgi:hypothetical protein